MHWVTTILHRQPERLSPAKRRSIRPSISARHASNVQESAGKQKGRGNRISSAFLMQICNLTA
ncbi:hypothetical protein H6F73_09470 [Microcoleus sp. FACHB-68]|nr:hypothetical protein [Microcoleus sp. FACHB-68]